MHVHFMQSKNEMGEPVVHKCTTGVLCTIRADRASDGSVSLNGSRSSIVKMISDPSNAQSDDSDHAQHPCYAQMHNRVKIHSAIKSFC